MQRYFRNIVLTAACAVMAVGCNNFLDITPSDRFSAEVIWSSESTVDAYIYGFYAVLRESCGLTTDMASFDDAYSDLIKSSSWNQYNHNYNMSELQDSYFNSTDAGCFEFWTGDSGGYNRIRRENEFLRDAPDYISTFGEEFITNRMAEVRFIRAYVYYRLMRVYGGNGIVEGKTDDNKNLGVVLRTEVDGPDENDKPRSTSEESWKQIIDDLQYAAENLPESWSVTGRATKAAAYALLSRVALYYGEYNSDGWQIAIDAANECANYSSLAADYADVFSDMTLPENIFTVQFVADEVYHYADRYFRPSGDAVSHGGVTVSAAFAPTAELADSYEMADGTDFSWSKYGSDPYSNREPRFYATILYNGASWEGREIQTYVGGDDGLLEFSSSSGAPASTVTGYYLRKWITEGETDWATLGSSHFAIMLRYGEVLLNKAEALARQNWSANKADALAALNQIRERVSLPDKDASTEDAFMEILRHERVVELAGEGLRYWDLRRWRIAEDVLHDQCMHGVKITKDEDTGALTYNTIEVDDGLTRLFYEKYYAFSIPITEMSNNSAIGENNFGW